MTIISRIGINLKSLMVSLNEGTENEVTYQIFQLNQSIHKLIYK